MDYGKLSPFSWWPSLCILRLSNTGFRKRELNSIFSKDDLKWSQQQGRFEYRADVAEATFLLDEYITGYLEKIYKKTLHMHSLHEKLEGVRPGEERSRIVDEEHETLRWLTDQLLEVKRRFAPYFNFRIWR